MFYISSALSSLPGAREVDVEDIWKGWIAWQKTCSSENYCKYQPLLALEKTNAKWRDLVARAEPMRYLGLAYCFGSFFPLLYLAENGCTPKDFSAMLLCVYDSCKGYKRTLVGDPSGIALLRRILETGDKKIFSELDTAEYLYPYASLHAHTVARFSLSTLILRIATHYFVGYDKTRPLEICRDACNVAYEAALFGPYSNIGGLGPSSMSKSRCISCFMEIEHQSRCPKCQSSDLSLHKGHVGSMDSYFR